MNFIARPSALRCLVFASASWATLMAQQPDPVVRQGVVTSLVEARQMANNKLRNYVYDTAASFVAGHNARKLEDLPAIKQPGWPALKGKTRLDEIRTVTRIAVSYNQDMTDYMAGYKINKDAVIAAAILKCLDQTAPQMQSYGVDATTAHAADVAANHASVVFWTVVEREGWLAGKPPSVPSPVATELGMATGRDPGVSAELGPRDLSPMVYGPRIPVDQNLRKGAMQSLPEGLKIKDADLRERLYDAWAFGLSKSSFKRIEDMRGSGHPTTPRMKQGTQADHMRGVGRLAEIVGIEMRKTFDQFPLDPQVLLAGALLHDVGKPFEFDPVNRKKWQADPRRAGFPAIRHSVYGAYVTLSVGLPIEVVNMVGAHSWEGRFMERSTAREIISEADLAFWDMEEAAGLMTP
jgi:putative nucleotidyltransferase with HDIG domain